MNPLSRRSPRRGALFLFRNLAAAAAPPPPSPPLPRPQRAAAPGRACTPRTSNPPPPNNAPAKEDPTPAPPSPHPFLDSSMASSGKKNKMSSSQVLGAPEPRTEADKHADEIFTQALALTFNALIDQGRSKEEAQAFVTSEEGKKTLLSVAKRLMIDRLSGGSGDDDDEGAEEEAAQQQRQLQQQQLQQQQLQQQQATAAAAVTQTSVPANASASEANEIHELSTELARLKQLQTQLKGLQQMAGAGGSEAGFRGADGGAGAMSNLHNLRES